MALSCPVIPGRRYLDWELDDPAGKPVEQLRPIRDEIEERVQQLIADVEGQGAVQAFRPGG